MTTTEHAPVGVDAGAWRLNVLGPVELCYEGRPVEVAGTTRTLLALLARTPGEEVATDTIVAAIWGGEPPEDCEKEVASHVSRLRKALTVVAPDCSPTAVVVTLARGYILDIEPSNADILAFERLVADGRRALAVGQPELAAARLDSALALWRGAAYQDFDDHAFVRAEAARLEDLRRAAIEARAEALREEAAPVATVVPDTLAGTVPACVGRDEEVRWLLGALDLAATRRAQGRLVVGAPGMGKTRLAAEVAQRAAARGVEVIAWNAGSPEAGAYGSDPLPVAYAQRLTLIVAEDLDRAAPEDVVRLATYLQGARTSPIAALVTCRDATRVGELAGLPKLVLSALDDAGIAEIVSGYAPSVTVGTAVGAMANTGGVPARVHRAASEWAFARAGRRIDRAVADFAEPRRRLALMRDEVIGGVADLAHVRARARQLLPTTVEVSGCPYRGLHAFDSADADLFHGRERLVAELVARLVQAPLVAVVGGVAAGASSLVRAGLLPALAAGVLPESGWWHQTIVTPSTCGRLADQLVAPVFDPEPEPEPPVASEGGEGEPTRGAAPTETRAGPRPVLLVVDQFEEVFTVLDGASRAAFLDDLVRAATEHRVVLTLRSDLYPRCAQHPELAALVSANTVLVGQPDAEELRRAIELPAASAGLSFEDGLVDLLVADTLAGPDGLAHLSLTLRTLWERRSGDLLTLAAYRLGGGVAGAVTDLAERAYQSLTDDEAASARGLLVRIRTQGAAPAVLTPTVAKLTQAGILAVAGSELVMAHDIVVDHWPRLRRWLEEESTDVGLRRHLAESAAAWDSAGRRGNGLYQGARLAAALDLARERPTELATVEHDFLGASQRVVLAADIRRRRRNVLLWKWLAAAVVVAVLAVAVAVVAVTMQVRASAAAELAGARTAATLALTEPDLRLALLLSVAAARIDPGSLAAVRSTLGRMPDLMATGGSDVTALVASPDGRTVLAGTGAGSVSVLGGETLRGTDRFELTTGGVNGLAYSRDGRRVIGWGGPRTAEAAPRSIVVWDLAARNAAGPAFGQVWPDLGGGLLADGDTLLLVQHGTDPKRPPTAVAWSLDSRTPSTAYVLPTTAIETLRVNADGRFAAFGTATGTVVTEPATGLEHAIAGAIRPIALSPDGRTLLTGAGSQVAMWSVAPGRRTGTASRHTAEVLGAAWSPDGSGFASVAADGSVVVWDAKTLQPSATYTLGAGPVRLVAFASDGRTLYTAADHGVVAAWDLAGGRGVGDRMATAPDLLRLACDLAGRDLGPDERRQFLPHSADREICPGL